MDTKNLRQKYLDFFRDRGHSIVSSSSLIPENDPTTLFTGSGMQPMVPYLLGEKHPEGTRIADSQKCFRAEDIEEVGDNRHTTFFEMLGNWSLGDYFKKEQITWMFDFITKELKLDPNKIFITVFGGDDAFGLGRDMEAVHIWKEKFKEVGIDAKDIENAETKGLQDGKIFYYNTSKNWWSRAGEPGNMPEGEPGGPDSEIFWDFGPELKLHENSEFKDSVCHVNCDCGRFMEIGNNVFMMYKRVADGFEELPGKNIDFGGGLERLVAAVNDDPDMFKIDVFAQARLVIEGLSGKKYGEDDENTFAFRVILDHLRAATFLISDGAVPSNKDQGYFTRRLMRRAIRYAHTLGIECEFCGDVARAYIAEYADAYPNLKETGALIVQSMSEEESKFGKTLETGLKKFNQSVSGSEISAELAFDLYQTYGFPLEMTEDLARERGLTVDSKGFKEAFEKHQSISRQGSEAKFKGGLADHSEETTKLHTATHLLHAALRKVLGDHVAQKGSNITADRLRFDFSHGEKMTPEQKQDVEDLVNGAIQKDYPVSFAEMTVKEAEERGAIGLFGDRYDARVKVYSIGDPDAVPNADVSSKTFSREICGGPHVERTGVLGTFKIKKEEASSAGVRRIKATLS